MYFNEKVNTKLNTIAKNITLPIKRTRNFELIVSVSKVIYFVTAAFVSKFNIAS